MKPGQGEELVRPLISKQPPPWAIMISAAGSRQTTVRGWAGGMVEAEDWLELDRQGPGSWGKIDGSRTALRSRTHTQPWVVVVVGWS